MEKKDLNTVVITVLSVVIAILLAVVVGGTIYVMKVRTQLAEAQAILHRHGMITRIRPDQVPDSWSSSDTAASGSVEEQLRAKGKRWVKIPGDITVGSYVQDTLEGRQGQPQGRGAIAKVLDVSTGDNGGVPAAMVDFGRGYTTGINLSELSLVAVVNR